MKIAELLNLISKKLGKTYTQSDLARGLGVTRQTICNRMKNNSEITIAELQKIENQLDMKLFNSYPYDNDKVIVDFYPNVFASCGLGTIVFSDDVQQISLPKALIHGYSTNKKYSIIHARGDSMTPFINNQDKLIIEHVSNNEIIDNKIYIFCYDSEIFVKRLLKNIGELIIKSDNPEYSSKTLMNNELNDFKLIGKIVGIIREI